ncbi:MAG: hypothetical protein HS115_20295 [Spirochaetales bacterium]|nr:hypothetical protein [Spirochaetales bacterium]
MRKNFFSFSILRWQLLCLVFLLYALAGIFKVASWGNVSAFYGFGCHPDICFARLNQKMLPEPAVVYPSGGYDGQFYYYLAAELGGAGPAVVDAPSFRRARIGFVWLTFWLYRVGPEILSLGMPLFLLLSQLILVYLNCERRADFMTAALALNPLSLLCFLLVLPDGFALQLALFAFRGLSRASPERSRAGFSFLLAFALLVKETMLAFPLALSASALLRIFQSGRCKKENLSLMAYSLGSVLPLLLWWSRIGFTPDQAASRGGWPFSGVIEYFSATPASGQYALLIILCAGLYRLRKMMTAIVDPQSSAGFILLGISLGLISLATGHEYWANFANIARLFLPLLGAFFVQRYQFPGKAVALLLIFSSVLILTQQLS